MKTVEVWCDIEAQAGSKVTADRREQPLRFGDDVGELDLTEEHYQELRALLKPWFDASHPPGQDVIRGLAKEEKAKRTKSDRIPAEALGGKPSRVWRRELRSWSDRLGLVNQEDPRFPAWQTTTGKHYYPALLEDAFILHEQGQEARSLKLVEKFKPQPAG